MNIQSFNALLPDKSRIADAEHFFGKTKDSFAEYLRDSFYQEHQVPALYVQEMRKQETRCLALIAQVPVPEYTEGRIKNHEKTLRVKEELQLQIFQEQQGMVKPVLLLHSHSTAIEQWLVSQTEREPLSSFYFPFTGEQIQTWELTDVHCIAEARQLYAAHVPQTTIADGHHRASTLAHLTDGVSNNLFCILMSANDVWTRAWNRAVAGLGENRTWLSALATKGTLSLLPDARPPLEKHEMTIGFADRWYTFQWSDQILDTIYDPVHRLDTVLLQELILQDALHITDIKTETRISYLEADKELPEIKTYLQKRPGHVVFCLYPLAAGKVMELADRNILLPPKSTWFEPRIKNGIVACRFKG